MVSSIILVVVVMLMGFAESISFVEKQKLDETLQITTTTGIIQGRTNMTFGGRPFWSFRGIPYGRPPVGNLRFRAPKPTEPWEGVLDATQEGPSCVEVFVRTRGVFSSGTEDCLIVNVFTPMDPRSPRDPLPVLVWFYGGAFVEGNSSSTLFGPEFLLDEDIVVVTLNYRVGLFGFLSTEDSVSPGNYGLKDQLLALSWVQVNIKNFGGDPNRVTISGQSSGAFSVFYHVASPKSKGLFHGAIANSGTSLSAFARTRNPSDTAFKVGDNLGINTDSSKELVSKLRMVDLNRLKSAAEELIRETSYTVVQQGFPFGPVIEHDHKNAFISEGTYSLLEKGQFNRVPIITGTTSNEAAFFQALIETVKPYSIMLDLSPGSLPNPSMNIDPGDSRTVGREIIKFYFEGESAYSSTVEEIEDLMNDDIFVRPLRKTAQLAFKYTPMYMYVFSYKSDYGLRGFDNELKGLGRGVAHIEDLTYIWKRRDHPFPHNLGDISIVVKMVKLWANFAKTGNPTPAKDNLLENVIWPSVNSDKDIKYLDIDSTFSIKSNFRDTYMRFWDYLYNNYGGKPYITY